MSQSSLNTIESYKSVEFNILVNDRIVTLKEKEAIYLKNVLTELLENKVNI